MAKWTNKYKIIEDLSVAQGRIVPASLEAAFGENSPPRLSFTEETEEEYYKECIGDGDFTSGPDIGLIQEMLSLVKDHTVSSDDDTDKVVVISKLNSTNQDLPSKQETNAKKTVLKLKKKRERNVALTSLLNNIEKENEKKNINFKNSTLTECPMFRRKKAEKPRKPLSKLIISNSIQQPIYVPSSLAKDYYEKYLENNKKMAIQEDLWTRLERDLKIIDERKKLEMFISSSPSTSSQASFDDAMLTSSPAECASALDKVCLPQQRHLLTSGRDCTVCEVFKKNIYDIKGIL